MNPIRDAWQSIFRRDPLSTDKGKSELVFLNVWLHIHPAKVKKENLKLKHTFYLGFITFYLFLILVTTGIALMFYYRPHPPQAYQDMKDLQFVVYLGSFLRNMHRWAAHGMVICVFLHMCRVFYTGSYKRPRAVQLGHRRLPVSADPGAFLHRLSAALGPTGVLGHHRGDEHRQLRSAGGKSHSRVAAGRPRGGRLGATALLRAARSRAAGPHGVVDHGALLAGPQRRGTFTAGPGN